MDDFYNPYDTAFTGHDPQDTADENPPSNRDQAQPSASPAQVEEFHNPPFVAPVAQHQQQPDIWEERRRREEERRAQMEADAEVASALAAIEMDDLRNAPQPANPNPANPDPLADAAPGDRVFELLQQLDRDQRQARQDRDEICCSCETDDMKCCYADFEMEFCGCCGCTGFFCIEATSYMLKMFLQAASLTFAILMIVYISSNSRPFEDIVESWSYPPMYDIQALPADLTVVYCPDGWIPYRQIGSDSYTVGSGKHSTTYTEKFYTWKGMRFCIDNGPFTDMYHRQSPDTEGNCPFDTTMCGGLCYEGSVCPIQQVEFSSTITPIPVADGVSWKHHDTYYSIGTNRVPASATPSIPLLGFSASVSYDRPPVKCTSETESSQFTHKTCKTPNKSYTLIDQYQYPNTNNARLFYNDNGAIAYLYRSGIESQSVGFFSRPEARLHTGGDCPYTMEDLTNFKYYTKVIFRTGIAAVTMVAVEFLYGIMAYPILFIFTCDNESTCCPRSMNALQFGSASGTVLSMVVLIYSYLLYNGANNLAVSTCFDSDLLPVFNTYAKDLELCIIFTWVTFGTKLVVFLYDTLYWCLWNPCDAD